MYISRSLILVWYFMTPPTPSSTLVFSALMGFSWLGVSPPVSGAIAEMFGLRWQAMIAGIAFSSHQLGSFPRRSAVVASCSMPQALTASPGASARL